MNALRKTKQVGLNWRGVAVLAAILAVCLVLPLGLSAATPPKKIVVERDTSYNPDDIKIKVGQVMEVQNRDEFWHASLISKVDENGFEIEEVYYKRRDVRGGEWQYTFEEPGRYLIRCTNHDGMTADVQVTE